MLKDYHSNYKKKIIIVLKDNMTKKLKIKLNLL